MYKEKYDRFHGFNIIFFHRININQERCISCIFRHVSERSYCEEPGENLFPWIFSWEQCFNICYFQIYTRDVKPAAHGLDVSFTHPGSTRQKNVTIYHDRTHDVIEFNTHDLNYLQPYHLQIFMSVYLYLSHNKASFFGKAPDYI